MAYPHRKLGVSAARPLKRVNQITQGRARLALFMLKYSCVYQVIRNVFILVNTTPSLLQKYEKILKQR